MSINLHGGLGGQVQQRDFGRLASGNSRILVPVKFRVVKLTKALKPEKSAQKRVQVSAQASDIRIFSLTASAVCSASKKRRGRARVRLTFQSATILKIQVRQRGAVREGIQSPCGSEQSKYRQRCQGVQVSDGLGGQGFKLAIARPRGAGTDLRETGTTRRRRL